LKLGKSNIIKYYLFFKKIKILSYLNELFFLIINGFQRSM
jgi:hypothetical protein